MGLVTTNIRSLVYWWDMREYVGYPKEGGSQSFETSPAFRVGSLCGGFTVPPHSEATRNAGDVSKLCEEDYIKISRHVGICVLDFWRPGGGG